MSTKDVELRCRLCHNVRFLVPVYQEIAPCPECGTRWRLRWFDDDTPVIVSVERWTEWERKIKEQMEAVNE